MALGAVVRDRGAVGPAGVPDPNATRGAPPAACGPGGRPKGGVSTGHPRVTSARRDSAHGRDAFDAAWPRCGRRGGRQDLYRLGGERWSCITGGRAKGNGRRPGLGAQAVDVNWYMSGKSLEGAVSIGRGTGDVHAARPCSNGGGTMSVETGAASDIEYARDGSAAQSTADGVSANRVRQKGPTNSVLAEADGTRMRPGPDRHVTLARTLTRMARRPRGQGQGPCGGIAARRFDLQGDSPGQVAFCRSTRAFDLSDFANSRASRSGLRPIEATRLQAGFSSRARAAAAATDSSSVTWRPWKQDKRRLRAHRPRR